MRKVKVISQALSHHRILPLVMMRTKSVTIKTWLATSSPH